MRDLQKFDHQLTLTPVEWYHIQKVLRYSLVTFIKYCTFYNILKKILTQLNLKLTCNLTVNVFIMSMIFMLNEFTTK